MATATKKTVRPGARDASGGRESAPLEFLIYGDNGGEYHWEIVGDRGESLTRSGSFACHDDAERAARYVYDGAGRARFEPALAEASRP
jgi:hypothetical protein